MGRRFELSSQVATVSRKARGSTRLVPLRAMTDESRIRELLEEILDSGSTPELVCAEFPNLLPEVQKRWRRLRRVVHGLDLLFPSSTGGEGRREKTDSKSLSEK